MEVNLHQSGFSEADLEEVKENESFMQFVENYEQAYMYCEKQNEPGAHIGNGHLLLRIVKSLLSNQNLSCTSVQIAKYTMKHLRCIAYVFVYLGTCSIISICVKSIRFNYICLVCESLDSELGGELVLSDPSFTALISCFSSNDSFKPR